MEGDYDTKAAADKHFSSFSKHKVLQEPEKTSGIFGRLPLRNLIFHLQTIWLFPRSNLLEVVIMPFVFAITTAAASGVLGFPAPILLIDVLQKAPHMLFWSWSNLLLFCIHNQLDDNSILEDKANKPWRPLPSGRITSRQSKILLTVLYPAVALHSWIYGGFNPFLLEAVSSILYNQGGAQNAFLKNLLNGTGFLAFLSGPLEILIGPDVDLYSYGLVMTWICLLSVIIFTTSHLQDFRDQKGDSLQGRSTLPLLIGDMPARWLSAVFVLCLSFLGPAYWSSDLEAYLLTFIPGCIMNANLMFHRTWTGDKLTWRIWPLWLASFFFVPLLKVTA